MMMYLPSETGIGWILLEVNVYLRRHLHGSRSEICPHSEISDRSKMCLRLFTWACSEWVFTRGENLNGPSMPLTRKVLLVFTRYNSNYSFQNGSTNVNRSSTWKIVSVFTTIEMGAVDFESNFLNLLLLQQ